MNPSSRFDNQEHLVIPSLQRIAYIHATEHVQSFIAQRAKGVILQDISPTAFGLYRKLEDLQMVKVGNDILSVFKSEVRPTVESYIQRRFGPELTEFQKTAETDIFDNIDLVLCTQPTTLDQCLMKETRTIGDRVASCGYATDGDRHKRVINIYFEDFMESEIFDVASQEGFDDAILQVLTHEYLHAVSAKRNMTADEEKSNQKVVALREAILGESCVYWEDLATSFGYAGNFVDTEGYYRIISGLESINEAITETIAAKAYSEYTANKYGKASRYTVSYKPECHAFYRTLRYYAKQWNLSVSQLLREIEIGYFFSDERRENTMNDRILPMLGYYLEIRNAQVTAG